MTYANIIGVLGGIMTLASTYFYVPSILRGETRPHIFTWLVWSLVLAIGCAAQLAGGAALGACAVGGSALSCIVITIVSIKYGERDITRSDWVALIAALAIIPVWQATGDPLVAAILVTIIDTLGYWPTVRKSWRKPWGEAYAIYVISGIAYVLALSAVAQWNLTTVLYPAVLVVWDFGLTGLILMRRRALAPAA